MVYTSTHAFRQSMPHRSPSQRPRSLSLSEYQPLAFDREATALAYRTQLYQPVASSNTSSYTPSIASHGEFNSGPPPAPSSLSQHLRRGDNPHLPRRSSTSGEFSDDDNLAGVGAGHALSPPQSPIHQTAQEAHRTSLNLSAGVSGSSLESGYTPPSSSHAQSPELPQRPEVIPESAYPAVSQLAEQGPRSASGIQRSSRPPSWLSAFGNEDPGVPLPKPAPPGMTSRGHSSGRSGTVDDGWDSDPGYPRYVGGRGGGRRLPPVPADVPAPEPPGWEPDYKPQIPAQLTQSSIEHAYAQLSAPPPGLPPRRNPRQSAVASSSAYPSAGGSSSQYTETPSSVGGQGYSPATPMGNHDPSVPNGSFAPPAGAPSFPFTPISLVPKPRRPAEESVNLRADGRTPIWSTHYLDPSLRNSLVSFAPGLSDLTNKAISNLAAKDSGAAAQVDGMARLAKGWFVAPDGKFSTDKGAIELGVGIIDCGGRDGEEGWGREKGRKRARVEVGSRTGGIKVDLIELDDNRQVDLKIDTKSGDILLLLPRNFIGSINVTTPGPDPHFCQSLSSAISPVTHPYETVYTTFVSPPLLNGGQQTAGQPNRGITGNAGKKRWVPEFLRSPEEPIGTQGGHIGGDWSKVDITQGGKGKVILGYRDEDESEVMEAGVRVGMEGQEKKKRWWR